MVPAKARAAEAAVLLTFAPLFLLAAAGPAFAENLEIGVVSGLLFPDDDVVGSGPRSADFAATVGATAALARGEHWALFGEGILSHFNSSRPTGDVDFVEARGGARIFPFGLSPEVALFAEAAVGWMRLDLANRPLAVDRPFASIGVGQRIRLTDRVFVHWETRFSRAASDDGDPIQGAIGQPTVILGLSVGVGGGIRDKDQDGVRDSRDACANTPRGAKVDASGCPKDADWDGVFDGLDNCPDTPRGVPVDTVGCSQTIDSDGDGVPDGLDRCPETSPGTVVDAWGCERLELFRPLLPRVLEGVAFEAGTLRLLEGSFEVLDELAGTLAAFPDDRFELGGHTDSRGDVATNRDISRKRAEVVRAYLIAHGVSPHRLFARGYGEDVPIADNSTEEGREQNRRIELRRLDGE